MVIYLFSLFLFRSDEECAVLLEPRRRLLVDATWRCHFLLLLRLLLAHLAVASTVRHLRLALFGRKVRNLILTRAESLMVHAHACLLVRFDCRFTATGEILFYVRNKAGILEVILNVPETVVCSSIVLSHRVGISRVHLVVGHVGQAVPCGSSSESVSSNTTEVTNTIHVSSIIVFIALSPALRCPDEFCLTVWCCKICAIACCSWPLRALLNSIQFFNI